MVKMSYYTDYSNYTDGHDVDEDLRTIMAYGGAWIHDKDAGVAFRDMLPSNTDGSVWLDVASRCCTIQKKINITHLLTRVSDDKLHFHLC
jgi:hypothetical protein